MPFPRVRECWLLTVAADALQVPSDSYFHIQTLLILSFYMSYEPHFKDVDP